MNLHISIIYIYMCVCVCVCVYKMSIKQKLVFGIQKVFLCRNHVVSDD